MSLRTSLVLGVLVTALLAPQPLALRAEALPRFTVTVRSAFLRVSPSLSAARSYSVFRGQSYTVSARTADMAWLRLDFPAARRGTWILASYGTVAGELSAVPVEAAGATAATPVPRPTGAAATAPAAFATTAPALPEGAETVAEQVFLTKVDGVYVYDAPRATAQRISRLARDQAVTAIGRDATGTWVEVVFSGRGWVQVSTGVLQFGNATVPISAGAPLVSHGTPRLGLPGPLPPWIPSISPRLRLLYQRAARNGRSPRMFAVVGDCNSLRNIYLEPILSGGFNVGDHTYLNSTLDQFRPALYRDSLAVNGGFSTAGVLDPLWANPRECGRGESPYACELRVSMASVVLIQLGTGDTHAWRSAEANYRSLIEYALRLGVVPVLVTKADALETSEGGAPAGYLNDVERRLAAEYQVPVFDFDQATSGLNNHGLLDEGNSDFHLDAEAIYLHILGTLQTLYLITQ